MNVFQLITELEQGEQTAIQYVLGDITQEDVNGIAKDDYLAKKSAYTGAGAQATLADKTFNDCKHFLRGKIRGAVDVAWQIEGIRTPLRTLPNQAAQTVLAAPPA